MQWAAPVCPLLSLRFFFLSLTLSLSSVALLFVITFSSSHFRLSFQLFKQWLSHDRFQNASSPDCALSKMPEQFVRKPRLQYVADECPGTRWRSRDNRQDRTEQLRGGHWALHFGRKRRSCTNSLARCTMIFSRRSKKQDFYRTVLAPCTHRGKRRNGEVAQWTLRLDRAGGYPPSLTESSVRQRAQEKAIHATLWSSFK